MAPSQNFGNNKRSLQASNFNNRQPDRNERNSHDVHDMSHHQLPHKHKQSMIEIYSSIEKERHRFEKDAHCMTSTKPSVKTLGATH
jgi:hypothetical protein